MKISKAIENQEGLLHHWPPLFNQDSIDATKLGIEALKRHQLASKSGVAYAPTPLPSETPE